MTLIAKNIQTGDFLEDLGMKGDFPYSSYVGRRFCLNGETTEEWYPTEINPRGKTQLERDDKERIAAIRPTLAVKPMVFHNLYWAVNLVGEGFHIPDLGLKRNDCIANSDRGIMVQGLPDDLVQEIENKIAAYNERKQREENEEFDYEDSYEEGED